MKKKPKFIQGASYFDFQGTPYLFISGETFLNIDTFKIETPRIDALHSIPALAQSYVDVWDKSVLNCGDSCVFGADVCYVVCFADGKVELLRVHDLKMVKACPDEIRLVSKNTIIPTLKQKGDYVCHLDENKAEISNLITKVNYHDPYNAYEITVDGKTKTLACSREFANGGLYNLC